MILRPNLRNLAAKRSKNFCFGVTSPPTSLFWLSLPSAAYVLTVYCELSASATVLAWIRGLTKKMVWQSAVSLVGLSKGGWTVHVCLGHHPTTVHSRVSDQSMASVLDLFLLLPLSFYLPLFLAFLLSCSLVIIVNQFSNFMHLLNELQFLRPQNKVFMLSFHA